MKDENRLNMIEEKKASPFKRFLIVLLITALLFAGALYGALYVLFCGPFVHAAAAFAQDVGDTPVGSVVMGLFLTQEEQEALLSIDSGIGVAEGDESVFSVYPIVG